MQHERRLLAATLVLGASGLTVAPARAVDYLTAWPGNWSCVSTESDQAVPERSTMHASTFGKWIVFDGNVPAHDGKQAHSFVTLVTYDRNAKKWFIDSYGKGGKFIISTSSAGPDATRQTWTNIYPLNPAQEPGTIVETATTWDTYDAWSDRGKRITAHTSCKKT